MKIRASSVDYSKGIAYFSAFCVLLFLFWKMPFFSDDYEFADLVRTKSFDEVINYILYYGNGRLLGNTFAIFLVNTGAVSAVVIKAATVLGILILLPRVLGFYSAKAFFLSFLMVMGVAPQIYSQVFIWTSGFVNFTFSVLLSLMCVYFVGRAKRQSFTQLFMIAVLGVASQLFVEHVSIVNIVVSAGMVCYFWHKDVTKRDAALAYFVGSILGAVMMLLLPHIFYVEGNRAIGYRKVHTDSIASIVRSVVSSLQLMIVTLSRCTLLFSVTSCFGCLTHRKTHNAYSWFAKTVYLLFPLVSLLFNIREGIWIPPMVRYGTVYGGMLVYCIVLAVDVLKIADKKTKVLLLWLVFLAMLAAAPFLIVTPFGERCLFLAYVLLAMFAIKAVFFAADQQGIRFSKSEWVLSAFSMLLAAILLTVTANIRKWDNERNEYIEACMDQGEVSIEIYDIPSSYGYKIYLIERWYYYESWGDISFTAIEYEAWLEETAQ